MDFDTLTWSIAEGSHDGSPIVIRFRRIPATFPRADYSHRLNIFWTVASPTKSGMPSATETQRLHDFEDRLIDAVERDQQGILSIALTGDNQREFVFHTRDTGDFLRRLTEMPQERDRYPIEIHCNEDADWDYVDRVLADIQP